MSLSLTNHARRALSAAAGAAAQRDQRAVEPRHFLLGLLRLDEGPVFGLLSRLGVEPHDLVESLERSLPRTQRSEPPDSPPELPYTSRGEQVLATAERQAGSKGREQVSAPDILLALATERGITRTILGQFDLDAESVGRAISRDDAADADADHADEPTAPEGTPGEEIAAESPAAEPASPDAFEEDSVEEDAFEDEPPPPAADKREPRRGLSEAGGRKSPDSTPAFRDSFRRSAAPSGTPEMDEDGAGEERDVPAAGTTAAEAEDGPEADRATEPAAFRGRIPEATRSTPSREAEPPPRPSPSEEITEAVEDEPAGPDGPEVAEEPGPPGTASLDFLELEENDTPLYEQIARGLRSAVATGALQPGRRLPSVRTLARELSVSPGTSARAYQELEDLGVVATRGRRGTFVASPERDRPPRRRRRRELADRLRPVAVAAFYMGAEPDDVRAALEEALDGILT